MTQALPPFLSAAPDNATQVRQAASSASPAWWPHRLADSGSITVRAAVSMNEAISDAIAASAESRALLANPSAAIREATLDGLIAQAAGRLD